jgi:hypothetical protein
MYSRGEEYRRRGIEARQRAVQARETEAKQTLECIAREWFPLAEQVEWLEGCRQSRPPMPQEKPK